jgi:hypothetical protein
MMFWRPIEAAMITFTAKSALIFLAFVSFFCLPAFGQVTETEAQKLIPIDLDSGDRFGSSVAVDGDTAIIGAAGEGDVGSSGSGAAYVFTRSGGVWTEQAKLLASDRSDFDFFGSSVALDGDTAIIGAFGAGAVGSIGNGAVYVFTRSGGVWTEQAKLLASDGDSYDYFGNSVALDGDTAVIGASGEDDGGTDLNGAAYVFTRSGGVWTEQAKLLASDKSDLDLFGSSVALDGDTAIIGEDNVDDSAGLPNGTAYVFTRSDGVWTEQVKLLPSDRQGGDKFGYSVALDGDTAVIGAYSVDDGETRSIGAAYIFTRSGGDWIEKAKLMASDKFDIDLFGYSVALDGDTALIAAYRANDGGKFDTGAAYVFTRSGGVWTEQVKLLASDRDSYDYFGNSVALSGDTAIIGALDKDDGGVAYVFALTPVVMDPVAMDDGPFVLDEGGELVEDVNILDNDSNPGGGPLTPVVVDPPAHASFFQVMPDGAVNYTHDGGETTSDSFTYRASDGVNESEIATVSLEITPVNDAPQVRLVGQSTISIERGAVYTDPGATAEDAEDGDISDSIVIGGDTVDTNAEGTYLITYNVTDSDGLAADEVTRTVVVAAVPPPPPVDQPPTITLNGDATVTLTEDDSYSDAGATASDPEDGDLTAQIVVNNPVDTGTPGTYTVTYTVEDSGGNQAQVERTVTVEAAPQSPPPQTDRGGGGGGGGAMAPIELLASMLMLLVIGGHRQRSAFGRFARVSR